MMKYSIQLLKKNNLYPIKTWLVPSRSMPGASHKVSLFADNHYECDCMAFITHASQLCYHIQKIQASVNPKQITLWTEQ